METYGPRQGRPANQAIDLVSLLARITRNRIYFEDYNRSPLRATLHTFEFLEQDAKTLHRAIIAILTALNRNPDEMRVHGLRINGSEWAMNRPNNSLAAFEEIMNIIRRVYRFIVGENAEVVVTGFDQLFFNYFWMEDYPFPITSVQIRRVRREDPIDQFPVVKFAVPGASADVIDTLGTVAATKDDEDFKCNICISKFKETEELRCLSCSHRFHKDCIDDWLHCSATCPSDRTKVFE